MVINISLQLRHDTKIFHLDFERVYQNYYNPVDMDLKCLKIFINYR